MRTSTLSVYRRSINSIMDMQTNLARTQTKIASGRKILHNHENPLLASRVKNLRGIQQQLEIYSNNAVTAENRLSLVETNLTSMINLVEDVYQLHKQAANGTLTNNERELIANEMRTKLDEMINLANAKDEKGEYLFAGYQGFQKPFIRNADTVSYYGDQGQRFIQVSSSTFVPISESGEQLFNQIRMGNGDFITRPGTTPNTGTGVIAPGSVIDFAGFIPDDYNITFVTNSSAELAYTVTDSGGGQVIPPPPAVIPNDAPAYRAGDQIVFNGHEVTITGQPAVGDVFEVKPSGYQNVFSTLQNIINQLQQPISNETDKAIFNNRMMSEGASLDRAIEHMLSQLTRVGTQSAIVDNEARIAADLLIQNQQALSNVQDLDYAQAISELNLATSALQAAQISYMKLQEMSLLNYIR